MKVTDPVPRRQGWTFGAWSRDRGEFRVAVFHAGSGVGVWASGRTREDAVVDAQRQIDALYDIKISTWAEADPIEERCSLLE